MSQEAHNSENNSHSIELGKIGRPHGVRGEVRLFLYNPESDLIGSLDTIFLVHPENGLKSRYKIRYVKESARFHILSLKNVCSREQAQELNGLVVQVSRDRLPEPEDGEYYVADLMGMTVLYDGQTIGTIVGSRPQGGIEVVSVENETREIQIPLVGEYMVKMDFSSRMMEVRNIEFLPVFEFSRKG